MLQSLNYQSVYGETPVQETNVDALTSLNWNQIYWLKKIMGRRLVTDKACEVMKEYMSSVCDNSSSNISTSGSEDTDTE